MTWECNHMERVKGFDVPCGHINKNSAEVCEECGSPKVYFCSEHHKSWTKGGECTTCAEIRGLKHRAETAESSLAAMRQRAEEAESRAERAEEVLSEIERAIFLNPILTIEHAQAVFDDVGKRINSVFTSSPPADTTKMGGGRERRLADSLDEILNYSGGADNALEDEYVMERAIAALADMEQKA